MVQSEVRPHRAFGRYRRQVSGGNTEHVGWQVLKRCPGPGSESSRSVATALVEPCCDRRLEGGSEEAQPGRASGQAQPTLAAISLSAFQRSGGSAAAWSDAHLREQVPVPDQISNLQRWSSIGRGLYSLMGSSNVVFPSTRPSISRQCIVTSTLIDPLSRSTSSLDIDLAE